MSTHNLTRTFVAAVCLGFAPSVLSQTYSKTEAIEYHDDLSSWVIGQRKKLSVSGTVVNETIFNTSSLPQTIMNFGKIEATYTYHANGTLASSKDGNNSVTHFSDWKRGIPQAVAYPATPEAPTGSTQTAVVSTDGWITALTDENGYRTNYTYDVMGRVTGISYPSSDTTSWNNVAFSYQRVSTPDRGLPGGHWMQVRMQGNRHTHTYYDGLWRAVMVLDYDISDPTYNTQAQTIQRYDANGRLAFVSYPTRHIADFNQSLLGTWTTYDALGRIIESRQDSELGQQLTTSTQYISGFQTLVTNPRGQQTVTAYLAYDQPTYDQPHGISELGGDRHTEIYRNLFGQPFQVRRRNGSGTESAWRYYVYDGHQQLCKMVEPETGATILDYDGAGNLQWSANGTGLNSTTSCDTIAGRDSGRKVTRYYDARNRLTTLNFPDGNGDQNLVYWPDGLIRQVTTFNDSGTTSVVNSYDYNKRRLLVGESSAQPGWYAWGIGYGYDANGSLSTQTYPTGLIISYAPNALGQATRAGSYASGVQYYPNGAIQQFTFGNGLTHSMSQNARQLPDRVTDGGNALDHQYVYDANGNPTGIYDYIIGAPTAQHRYLGYDGLDRLTAAGSAMFGGSDHYHRFTYDAMDNLKSWKHAGIKDYADYVYTSNRLTNIKNIAGSTVVGLDYDVQGNLANKNGQIYRFDFGNRLREVTGKEYYRYDGQGRRVMSWRPTATGALTLGQYSHSGQLMYDQNDQRQLAIEYIYLGGSLVATRERPYSSGTPDARYQHTDALGSPVAVTNTAGSVIDRTSYEPYGVAINKPAYDGVGYTGHVQDSATGMTYMQQRYYDPVIGRFISGDPVASSSGTWSNFNRYWYANNNPYKFTDPDGRLPYALMNPGVLAAFDQGSRLARMASIEMAARIIEVARTLPPPSSRTEARIYVSPDLTATPATTETCTDHSCEFTGTEARSGGAAVHLHNVVDDSKLGRISREFPGGGDYRMVEAGSVNAVVTPSGAIRLVERYIFGIPGVRTIHGGNPRLNDYIQQKWKPLMRDSQINSAARSYRGPYP